MNGALNLHPKVVGGALAGSFAILIVYALSLAGIQVPDVASAALTTVLGGIGGWLAPASPAPPVG